MGKVGAVILVVAVLAVVGMFFWLAERNRTPEEREARQQATREAQRRATLRRNDTKVMKHTNAISKGHTRGMKISEVGKVAGAGGGLACPRCGGAGFKARRSTKARVGVAAGAAVTFGVGAVAAVATKQKQVTCVTCGNRYARG